MEEARREIAKRPRAAGTVSEMLDSGRAMFKDLAADFEDRLCTIHEERVDKWEEEIRELRARDAANERTRALLHNAQLHLFHIRH